MIVPSDLISLFDTLVSKHSKHMKATERYEIARGALDLEFSERKAAKAERDSAIKQAEAVIKTLKAQN